MKQIMNGGGGGLGIPTAAETQVAEILLNMPELIKRRSFTWGEKKKRSVLVSKSESETHRRIVDGASEKAAAAAAEADKSPKTPLCFSPAMKKKNIKRKAANDLLESYNKMQQEKEILLRETEAMKTLHQGLTSKNLELKAIIQKVKYSRNIEDFHLWNNSRKIIDQQNYHPQISMFAPPTQHHHHHHHQQVVVDPNTWGSSNSHSGGRFGLFNQIDPRVKIHDFMGCSQPLDQSKYMMVENDLRVRSAAAAARQRRILRMKENKRVSRGCR